MTAGQPASAAELEAARMLLDRMGIKPADLLAAVAARPPAPTFAEYVPVVSAAVRAGTRRVYGSYWKKLVFHWGDRRIDEPTPSEIKTLTEYIRTHVAHRRNARGGSSAAEHFIAALRCLYKQAIDDGLIGEAENPAKRVEKPRRPPSTRRAVAHDRLAEINEIVATTGNDPELDTLLVRLHTCRRGGALALRPCDLDVTQCLIRLREKGETTRWQPVSPTLMSFLVRHAEERGASHEGQLLRYRDGRPITYRRYDRLWARVREHLPWAAALGISTHWLRHTTLTWVERSFGHAVAREYAGHSDNGSEGTTAIYVRATLEEVATALSALVGEPHPLAA
ncbi:tyrosine-type recombinase/integrase [Cryptosporangium sp. NPDC048952]|uniref:tyrosine-type recombinase/integrase n=1 Tax=Cryptosporangium sp. NPDC048952 TaxID=3363961 RepID=UPI0037109A7B